MIFIISQDDLSRVFGNEVVAVEGEKNLFDKIALQLELAENLLVDEVVGDFGTSIAPGTSLFNACVTFVACHALRDAIPSLDLILTPNGFGVVQNNNFVPASKERVERLSESMQIRRDTALNTIIKMLMREEGWQDSEQRQWFAQGIFQLPELSTQWCKRKDYTDDWEALKAMRLESLPILQRYRDRYISNEVLDRVQLALCSNKADDLNDRRLGKRLISIVLREMNGTPFHHKYIDPIVNYLREVDDDWKASSVAALYAEPVFQNSKKSPGYFF